MHIYIYTSMFPHPKPLLQRAEALFSIVSHVLTICANDSLDNLTARSCKSRWELTGCQNHISPESSSQVLEFVRLRLKPETRRPKARVAARSLCMRHIAGLLRCMPQRKDLLACKDCCKQSQAESKGLI